MVGSCDATRRECHQRIHPSHFLEMHISLEAVGSEIQESDLISSAVLVLCSRCRVDEKATSTKETTANYNMKMENQTPDFEKESETKMHQHQNTENSPSLDVYS